MSRRRRLASNTLIIVLAGAILTLSGLTIYIATNPDTLTPASISRPPTERAQASQITTEQVQQIQDQINDSNPNATEPNPAPPTPPLPDNSDTEQTPTSEPTNVSTGQSVAQTDDNGVTTLTLEITE